MKWEKVVNEADTIDIERFKSFIESSSADAYVLIDVRQPGEYAKSHIPGAISMPLNELVAGKFPLPEKKPLFVYSRLGARSKAAVQWFLSQDIKDVKEIEGGFDSWTGNRASGQYDLNINLFKQDIEFNDAFSMAYAMEEGLRRFYLEIARKTTEPYYQKLYRRLASFEVEHKQALIKSYAITEGKDFVPPDIQDQEMQLMEGGGYLDETLIETLGSTSSVYDVFSLAIAFETQAFDFYVRLSRHARKPAAKKFFLEMADAEKAHLAIVSKEMDIYLNEEQ